MNASVGIFNNIKDNWKSLDLSKECKIIFDDSSTKMSQESKAKSSNVKLVMIEENNK